MLTHLEIIPYTIIILLKSSYYASEEYNFFLNNHLLFKEWELKKPSAIFPPKQPIFCLPVTNYNFFFYFPPKYIVLETMLFILISS